MNDHEFVFTSESVTEGHPDKVADQISDAILDAIMTQDTGCRVACETAVTTGMAMIMGEITTTCWVDMPQIIRETIRDIGYTDPALGFDWETCAVITSIDKQSPDIAMGVNGKGDDQGAGDQGMMFGYACEGTDELMPLPITLAHKLTRRLAEVRKGGILTFLRPDGKSQVTVRFKAGRPTHIDAVVVACHHSPEVTTPHLREAVMEEVIRKVMPAELLSKSTQYCINATGRFEIGGPRADSGMTGRKIIVDTYGGWGHHGGGCFSGKDPSKVDRSASYMARYVAKNIVAAALAKECEIQLAYSIGVPQPVSVLVDDFGTATVPNERLTKAVRAVFDFRPTAIIKNLRLLAPIYRKTAAYGHFGRGDEDFAWEKTDRVKDLRAAAGI